MKFHEFPAIYRHVDSAAAIYQSRYFRILFVQYSFLFIASGATVGNGLIQSQPAVTIYVGSLLVALGAQIWLTSNKPDRKWYLARALAESVKTLSWKYSMTAQPFDVSISEKEGTMAFKSRIDTLLAPHRGDPSILQAGMQYGDLVTNEMSLYRQLTVKDKIAVYRENRIIEQRDWYVTKALENKRIAVVIGVTTICI